MNSPHWEAANEGLEPAARFIANNDERVAMSVAISLKRLADELAVNSPGSTKTTLGDLVQAIADRMIP